MNHQPPFRKGAPLRAADLQALSADGRKAESLRAAPPLTLRATASGRIVSAPLDWSRSALWARIVSRDVAGQYAWQEVLPPAWVDGRRSGTAEHHPAYEVNDLAVADDQIVRLRPGCETPPDWRFEAPCCACTTQLCVSVSDCCGAIEGATVAISYTGPLAPETGDPTFEFSDECETNELGGCCIEVPIGYTYTVGVSAPGYTSPEPTTAEVDSCDQVLVEVELECCVVELEVTRCGEPLPDEGVSLISLDDPPQPLCALPFPIQTTDDNGMVSWVARPGQWELQLLGWTGTDDDDPCDGVLTHGPMTLANCPTTTSVAITVECPPNSCDGRKETIRVIGCYGHYLPDATVSLEWAECSTFTDTTDSNGLVEFEASEVCGSCPGTLTLTISKSRFNTLVITSTHAGYCENYDQWRELTPSSSYACGVPGCPDPIAKTLYLTVSHIGTATFPPAGSFTLTWDSSSTDWLSPCDGSDGRYRLDSASGLLSYESYTGAGCTGSVSSTYAFTNISTTCPPSFSSTQRRYIPDLSNYAEGVITE